MKKKYISPTSMAFPWLHSSVCCAPGQVKWKSTTLSFLRVVSLCTLALTLLAVGGSVRTAASISALVKLGWHSPSVPVSTV